MQIERFIDLNNLLEKKSFFLSVSKLGTNWDRHFCQLLICRCFKNLAAKEPVPN